MEPFNLFFIERKKAFLSQKGQQIYKLRAIHSEGAFSEIKEIQEFKQTKRIGRTKVEIDLILEAIVFNLRKIRNHLKCDINLNIWIKKNLYSTITASITILTLIISQLICIFLKKIR